MINKVIVVAGTRVDTKMGVELLEKNEFNVIGEVTLYDDPNENSRLQVLEPERLEEMIIQKTNRIGTDNEFKSSECAVFVYCNSIATSIVRPRLEEKLEMNVVTPLESYKEIAKLYNNIGVLAANCQASAGIEQILFYHNSRAIVSGISILHAVYFIENGEEPNEIIRKSGLIELVNYFKKSRYEIIILGCTHLPYIKKELEVVSEVTIFDPQDDMINKLKSLK